MTRIPLEAMGENARNQVIAKLEGNAQAEKKAAVSKYRNKPVTIDGWRFDSTAEGAYYLQLLEEQRAGLVEYFMLQVSVKLKNGKRYIPDFLVFRTDGSVEWVDVKGKETDTFKQKEAQFQTDYPVTLKKVYREDIPATYLKTAAELRDLQ